MIGNHVHYKITSVFGSGAVDVATFDDDERAAMYFEARCKQGMCTYCVIVHVMVDSDGVFVHELEREYFLNAVKT